MYQDDGLFVPAKTIFPTSLWVVCRGAMRPTRMREGRVTQEQLPRWQGAAMYQVTNGFLPLVTLVRPCTSDNGPFFSCKNDIFTIPSGRIPQAQDAQEQGMTLCL